VLREFSSLLDQLDVYPPKGLIIRSGKEPASSPAPTSGILPTRYAEKGRALVERGWKLFNRLEAVKYPTLALVRGHCLGGGLELALACRYLLAVDESGTKMGLPEVMLGIFPGWGGMLRLPKRVGPAAALDMMLTGKTLDAKRAKNGPGRRLRAAARHGNGRSSAGCFRPAAPPAALHAALMNGPLKSVVANGARKQVAKKARPQHYPAPTPSSTCGRSTTATRWPRRRWSTASFLADRPQPGPRLHLQERLKAFGKDSDFKARRVHVIGAGVMGGDIAAWCALRGMTVTLQDQTLERMSPALKRAHALFTKKLRDPLKARAASTA
jgi:3-hydroxyacyl-CoA dehydrogenase/enoyl-CoA hydratase/3-hydroxybutyryl-CoA epimerase